MESITEYIISELAKHDQYDGSSFDEDCDENVVTVVMHGEYYCKITVSDCCHVSWTFPRRGYLNGFCKGLRDRIADQPEFAGEWN